MRVLDLFSGIGGFSLGLERAGMTTVAFCEIEPFCQKILKHHWPNVPIFDDIRTLSGDDVGPVDLICGGYPCQPFSVAGKQRGKADDRHLWPEYYRLIQEIHPRWIIGENVAGHIKLGLDDVLSDLEREGYTWESFVVPACAVNAPHRRDRVCIVAHSKHNGSFASEINRKRSEDAGRRKKGAELTQQPERDSELGNNAVMADSESERIQRHGAGRKQEPSAYEKQKLFMCPGEGRITTHWDVEPDVGRVANGIPDRVDRIKSLGNSVVPQIPEILGRHIMELDQIDQVV